MLGTRSQVHACHPITSSCLPPNHKFMHAPRSHLVYASHPITITSCLPPDQKFMLATRSKDYVCHTITSLCLPPDHKFMLATRSHLVPACHPITISSWLPPDRQFMLPPDHKFMHATRSQVHACHPIASSSLPPDRKFMLAIRSQVHACHPDHN